LIEHLRDEVIEILNRNDDHIVTVAKDATIAVVNTLLRQHLSAEERAEVQAVLVEWRDALDEMIAELEARPTL
jgi:hypothetical protein